MPELKEQEPQISFRRMRTDDLPLLRTWLARPHVAEWWTDDAADLVEAVEAGSPKVPEGDGVSPWVIELDGAPVGFIQWYVATPDEAWWPGLSVPTDTAGIDLSIGEEDLLGKGLGRRVIVEFVHHVIRSSLPSCPEVWIDPNPRNERAVRAYRAAGFLDTGVDLPDPEVPGELRRWMRLPFPGPAFR